MTVYPGFTNSPPTTLTGDITNVATTIPVAELGVFPAAPNIAVIGTGVDAETIYYAGKSASSGSGNLTSVTREFDKTGTYGAKKAWGGGSVIARNFCKVDLDAVQAFEAPHHFEKTFTISPVGGDYTTIQAALTANATEYTLFQVYPGLYADDTIHFTANNQSVIGLDNSTTTILGSTSTNIVDFSTFTGCVLNRITARITGATTSAHTVIGSSGNIIINDCTLEMTNASYTGSVQPTVINIAGGGQCEIKFGFINYSNPVAQAGVVKAAIRIGAGCYIRLRRGDIQINGSGASAGTTLSFSAGSGRITATRSIVVVSDTGTDDVVGFYLNGTSSNDEVTDCDIHVTGSGNRATGIWNASTGTVNSVKNIVHVVSAGGTAKSYINSGTLNTSFDTMTAADGHTNTGTLNAINSQEDGGLYVTGNVLLPATTTIGDVSATELSYVNGVTSAIQTQIDLKAPLASPTFTGTVVLPSTTSIGTVSNTELSYVDGVTSAIQTQMDLKAAKASPTFTGTVTLPTVTLTGNVNTVTPTELSYVHNVTSAIQTQIDGLTLGNVCKPMYTNIVYQTATTTNAIDFEGNELITPILRSAMTDSAVIQAALDGAGYNSVGAVYIAPGHYYIEAPLTVPTGVEVTCASHGMWYDGAGTIFDIVGNIDFCSMASNTSWFGGWIITVDSTYNGTVFLLDASASIFSAYGNPGKISETIIMRDATSSGGTAIWLKAEGSGALVGSGVGVYDHKFNDLLIFGSFTYGIRMTTNGDVQYRDAVIWNKFTDITIYGCVYPIYMNTISTYSHIDHNYFTNCNCQTIESPQTVDTITVSGLGNTFTNMGFGDVNAISGKALNITSKATATIGSNLDIYDPTLITDSGVGSRIELVSFPRTKAGRNLVTPSSGNGTITHGFGRAPTWCVCNATTNANNVQITTLGATTITIHISTASGGNGTTQYINWMCGV